MTAVFDLREPGEGEGLGADARVAMARAMVAALDDRSRVRSRASAQEVSAVLEHYMGAARWLADPGHAVPRVCMANALVAVQVRATWSKGRVWYCASYDKGAAETTPWCLDPWMALWKLATEMHMRGERLVRAAAAVREAGP